jgi:hypothetical protein
MNIRKSVNSVLQKRGYQIVKSLRCEKAIELAPAQVIDNRSIATNVAPGRKHAWIIAAPKSGSTWLSALLEQLLGWPSIRLLNGHDRREQEVDVRPLLRHMDSNIISPHQHCRASLPTVDFIKLFRVQPVIQTRNILDTVASLRDHILNDSQRWPMAYVDGEFAKFSEEKQYDFIIDMFLPWYFNFYASWLRVEGIEPAGLLFVSYEEMMTDTRSVIRKILDYLKETRSDAEITAAIEKTGKSRTRFNKGVTGRGERLLSDRHKARVKALRDYYPHIDFSMVGL